MNTLTIAGTVYRYPHSLGDCFRFFRGLAKVAAVVGTVERAPVDRMEHACCSAAVRVFCVCGRRFACPTHGDNCARGANHD